jgi:GNAT superfamily N-acetyltransferase
VIRPFRDEDAAGVAGFLRTALATPWVVTERDVLHWQGVPERARRAAWVAHEQGELVGFADGQVRWEVSDEGVCELWAAVAPSRRRRGIGSELFETAWAHLLGIGARVVQTWAEEDDGKRFLGARGFTEVRQERISSVDPRTIELSRVSGLEAAKRAEGFRAVPVDQVLDRSHDLFELYMLGEADMPGVFAEDNIAFEEWEQETLAAPSLDHEGSFVVLHGERPVAMAWLEVDREAKKATNEMTATAPEFRRRGLARLAKLASLRWAAELGITSVLTSNDRENPAMLALNDSLGYRPLVVRGVFVRETAQAN